MVENGKMDLMNLLVKSDRRREILFVLAGQPKEYTRIFTDLGITSSQLYYRLKELEDGKLIIKKDRSYELTELGKMSIRVFNQFQLSLAFMEDKKEVLINHNIDFIPHEFRHNFNKLAKTHLEWIGVEGIFDSHSSFVDYIKEAKCLKAVTSVMFTSHPIMITALVEKGVPIALIVTPKLFNFLKERMGQNLQQYVQQSNARIYVCSEEIKASFAVTDSIISMAFYTLDNVFDHSVELIGEDEDALEWANGLFDYYVNRSSIVKSDLSY
jgi:predicted transcriptional regulator